MAEGETLLRNLTGTIWCFFFFFFWTCWNFSSGSKGWKLKIHARFNFQPKNSKGFNSETLCKDSLILIRRDDGKGMRKKMKKTRKSKANNKIREIKEKKKKEKKEKRIIFCKKRWGWRKIRKRRRKIKKSRKEKTTKKKERRRKKIKKRRKTKKKEEEKKILRKKKKN